jgi:hypothetical protein
VILEHVLAEFQQSDNIFPLETVSIERHRVALQYRNIYEAAKVGGWVDSSFIDWVVLRRFPSRSGTDGASYLPTNSEIYTSLVGPLAQFTDAQPEPIEAFRNRIVQMDDLEQMEETTLVVFFPLFVNQNHWLFVKTNSTDKTITLYDSLNPGY